MSGTEEEITSAAGAEAEDLDDLLCSALDEMTKPAEAPPAKKEVSKPTELLTNDDLEKVWNDEFADQFKQYLQGDSSADAEAVASSLQRMTEAATEALKQAQGYAETPTTPTSNDPVSAAITQTLRNLAASANSLQSPLTEDEIMNMFGNLGLTGEGPNGDSEIFPFMQNMMQSLLSKDILLPALQNIVEKYPAWIEEHRSSLSSDKLEGYTTQLGLMKEVCAELQRESPSDSDEVKNARFDKVLDIMQKMQDCGLPPQELMGDLPQELDPKTVPDMSQCSVM